MVIRSVASLEGGRYSGTQIKQGEETLPEEQLDEEAAKAPEAKTIQKENAK